MWVISVNPSAEIPDNNLHASEDLSSLILYVGLGISLVVVIMGLVLVSLTSLPETPKKALSIVVWLVGVGSMLAILCAVVGLMVMGYGHGS